MEALIKRLSGGLKYVEQRITGTVINEGAENEIRAIDVNAVNLTDGSAKSQIIHTHNRIKIIDNAVIGASSGTPAAEDDIDFKGYTNAVISYKLGAAVGGTPTLVLKVLMKDANGNYIEDDDYTSSALAASSDGLIKLYLEAYGTFQIGYVLGGSGTFAASDITVELKS